MYLRATLQYGCDQHSNGPISVIHAIPKAPHA